MNAQQLKRQLLADKKKLGILTTLLLVGLLMWGRLLLAGAPKTAIAKPAATASAPPASAAPAAKDEPTAASTVRDLPSVVADLRQRVTRDVFAFASGVYPPAPKAEAPPQNAVQAVVNYQTDPADKAKERERQVRLEAGGLKLQSTILGNQPRVLINGTLLAPGESIQGFEVESIASRAVTLTKESVTIVLEM